MKHKDDVALFVGMKGHAFGVGDPDVDSPESAEFCLLCGVTYLPVTINEWKEVLLEIDREGETLEEACNRMIERYGGITILKPSRIHHGEKARKDSNVAYVVEPIGPQFEA